MRVANKWVVVGAAVAVAGFAGGAAAGDTTRDIKLNDQIAVEEVAGQLSAGDPGQYVGVPADHAGQQLGDDDFARLPGRLAGRHRGLTGRHRRRSRWLHG